MKMKTLNIKTVGIASLTLFIGILFGWMLFGSSEKTPNELHEHTLESHDETIWTCSMHPQIRMDEAGNCPICGMTLIPLENGIDEVDPLAVSMTPTAMQLANVQSMLVAFGNASKTIRLEGKVQADERLLYTQSSHIPGRIEKLLVDFTGDYIAKGQVIAHIYSPDLIVAQEELFVARKSKETQPELYNAAKQKLKNWKLSDKQINEILSSNTTKEEFPILANVSGYVTKKMVNLGDYIKLGQPLFEIADLTKVWVLFDVYESEIAWLKKGDKVKYTIPSIPGEIFIGKLSYIDPIIDPNTRVAKARVEAENRSLKLKPEMFVSGEVDSKVNTMANSISVPKSAVLWTGKRSVVYIKHEGDSGVDFTMREVTLGPELGEYYVINSGLHPGEEIAVNGTFSIDAAAQLAGKPSMMNKEGAKLPAKGHEGMKME
jgi:Cu(I)/Ag(I) efflux system membrane fusion protein